MKNSSLFLFFLFIAFSPGCFETNGDSNNSSPDANAQTPGSLNGSSESAGAKTGQLAFQELWAYLMSGEEKYFPEKSPITDIGYFGAYPGIDGSLKNVPAIDKIKSFGKKNHLVVAETSNHALTHFLLNPALPLRKKLIADIAKHAVVYDGVQIDFEAVRPQDKEFFFSFLKDLKNALGSKTLSVAIPPKTGPHKSAYDYQKIAANVDRVVVMAYDQHWSTSAPGPVASLEWCQKVSKFALSEITKEKLIMGLPFYGRSWPDENFIRAYKYSSVQKLLQKDNLTPEYTQKEGAYVKFSEKIHVSLFYENLQSLNAKLKLYQKNSVKNISFWRIGQEDPKIWSLIKTN